MSIQPIKLYDIATKAGPLHPVASNVWKTRITLNLFGLPHETEWISMGEIENEAKALGAPPSRTKPLGGDLYTLPFIYDPRANKFVTDSYLIARHLEETYGVPKNSGRTIFPWSREDDEAFIDEHGSRVIRDILYPLLVLKVTSLLSEEGSEYMRRSRLEWYGIKLEDIAIPTERRAEEWAKLRVYLNEPHVRERVQGIKGGVTFRDIVLGATLKWIQISAEPGEFETILTWENGLWGEFFSDIEEYLTVN